MKDLRHAEDVLNAAVLSLGRPRKQIDTFRPKKLEAATVVPHDISLAYEAEALGCARGKRLKSDVRA